MTESITNEERIRRYINVLWRSISTDENYPIDSPFVQNGWCIGTDGHHMVRIKASLLAGNDNDFEERSLPNVSKVIPVEFDTPRLISLEQLDDVLDSLPLIYEGECSECNGTGKVKYCYDARTNLNRYVMEGDCPVCNGTGVETYEELISDLAYPVDMGGLLVSAKQIKWLADVMQTLDIKTVALRSHTGLAYFRYGKAYDFMFMGLEAKAAEDIIKEKKPLVLF